MGWPLSAEKTLNWTAKVGQLSEDSSDVARFGRDVVIGVRDTSQVGGSHPSYRACGEYPITDTLDT